MKIKRKIPVFSMIVQRVIESRFPEIESVAFLPNNKIQLRMHPDATPAKSEEFMWPYFYRLSEEFADPSFTYHFELTQKGCIISEMRY